MKALSSSMLALALAAMPIICSPAATDKTLQAKQGTVTYGAASIPTTKLAKNASATLNDNDYAATGANSLADLTLPDSSVVLLGENSNVQMKSFSSAGGTNTANFVVVGKVRFKVEHPAGAKASYTFQTPTGQIAVRGTEGDIFSQPGPNGGPGGLQVNVYQLTNPALPVQVSLVNGQVFTLAAGQSLVVTAAAAGALVGAVGAVSNSTFAPFTQLGAPANASSLGITTTTTTAAAGTTAAATTAATTASVTTAAVAAGTAAAVAVTSSNSKPDATPTPTPTPSPTPTPTIAPTMTPTPSPAPTGTSVPITISGKPGTGTLSPGAVNPPGPATMPGLPGTGTRVIQPPHPIGRPTPPHP